jgi:hypothetical protein
MATPDEDGIYTGDLEDAPEDERTQPDEGDLQSQDSQDDKLSPLDG